jgi:hypothetical protein
VREVQGIVGKSTLTITLFTGRAGISAVCEAEVCATASTPRTINHFEEGLFDVCVLVSAQRENDEERPIFWIFLNEGNRRPILCKYNVSR